MQELVADTQFCTQSAITEYPWPYFNYLSENKRVRILSVSSYQLTATSHTSFMQSYRTLGRAGGLFCCWNYDANK